MRPETPRSFGFPADPASVRRALAAVMRCPPMADAGADSRAAAELVLAEVLNNVVEHAYGGQGGQIALRLRRQDGLVLCRIADRGRPMPQGRLPDAALPAPAGTDLPQGGFGWPLIRALSHGLRYRRWRGCNVLVLALALDSPH
jgi:serine/threonine-protein kinase RsbW